jgi:hypothetical protein
MLSRGESQATYLGPLAPLGGGPNTAGPLNPPFGGLNSIVSSPLAGAIRSPGGGMLGRVLSQMTQSIPHMSTIERVAAGYTQGNPNNKTLL